MSKGILRGRHRRQSVRWGRAIGVMLWLAMMVVSPLTAVAAPTAAVLQGNVRGLNLVPYLEFIEDPSHGLSITDAQAAFARGDGHDVDRLALNLGFSSSRYWFHVALEHARPAERTVFLEIDYPVLDRLDVYCGQTGKPLQLFRLGDHVQYGTRAVVVRNYVVPLTLAPLERHECFFRVQSSSNVALPLNVSDTVPFIEDSRIGDWRLGWFYGLAFALLIYNLIVYIASRERVYLYYVIHVLASYGYNALLDGSMTGVWSYLDLEDQALLFFICLSQGAALLFAHEYLGYRAGAHWSGRATAGCMFFLLSQLLALPFVDVATLAPLTLYGTVAVSSLILALGIMQIHTQRRLAWPFVLGFGAVVLMALGGSLASLGVVQDISIATYGMKFAWMFELIMLSSGLGLRIDDMKQRQHRVELSTIEIQAQVAARNDVLDRMHDDIRLPLEGIIDRAERLRDTPLVDAQQRAVGAISVASGVIRDQLSLLSDSRRIALDASVLVDWPLLVQHCAGLFAGRIGRDGGALWIAVDAGVPRQVWADPSALRLLLTDLCLHVCPGLEGQDVTLQVGLADDILDERLMVSVILSAPVAIESSLRVAPAMLLSSTGERLLQLMGGRVGRTKGHGAWLYLPLRVPEDVDVIDTPARWNLSAELDAVEALPAVASAPVKGSDPEARPEPSSVTPLQRPHARDHWRILLAEDNLINQKVIVGFLDRLGMTAEVVTTGEQAVKAVAGAETRYDLIFLDCQMPVMDGFEAARRIREHERALGLRGVPIIGLSAHAGESFRQQSQQAGMNLYLTKPLTFRGVSDAISRVIEMAG